MLRNTQFVKMARFQRAPSVQPDQYQAMTTSTPRRSMKKGSELIPLLHTLLGTAFMAACAVCARRHDGTRRHLRRLLLRPWESRPRCGEERRIANPFALIFSASGAGITRPGTRVATGRAALGWGAACWNSRCASNPAHPGRRRSNRFGIPLALALLGALTAKSFPWAPKACWLIDQARADLRFADLCPAPANRRPCRCCGGFRARCGWRIPSGNALSLLLLLSLPIPIPSPAGICGSDPACVRRCSAARR